MAFWDDVKKSARDAADFTVKKTNEVSDLINLKLSLHAAESREDETFEALGRLFYESYKKGTAEADDAILSRINELDAVHEEIVGLKRELAKRQRVHACRSCGAEIDRNLPFCPYCGAKQDKDETADA